MQVAGGSSVVAGGSNQAACSTLFDLLKAVRDMS
jgi:hypothetical protein